MKSLTEEDVGRLLLDGEFGEYVLEVIAEQDVELDRATTRLDAALREIRELHGELTNLRAQVAELLDDDSGFDALARLGACQLRTAELEAQLAQCSPATGWPGR